MMRIPVATYRLQFTPDFGFDAATAIAPHLAELGVSDIYASPIPHAASREPTRLRRGGRARHQSRNWVAWNG